MLEAVARRSLSMPFSNSQRPTYPGKVTTAHAAITGIKCMQCKGDHQIYQCKAFKELSVAERLDKVKSLRLCLNCLKGKHVARECLASGCRKCSKKHSTLLHEDREPGKEKKGEENVTPEVNQNKTVCTHAQAKEILEANQVLLSTALVTVKDDKDSLIEGRALLDNGSQSNFVTEEFVKKLNLKTVKEKIEIKGIDGHVSHAMKSVKLRITSRFGTFGMELQCIVLPKITQDLPTVVVNTVSLELSRNIKLADPQFNIPGKIDLLIGAEKFWELICVGQIKIGEQKTILQKSLLGWLISGSIGGSKSKRITQTSCNLSVMEELNSTMRKFWEVEAYQETKNIDPEEEYCERHFKESHSQSNGRFMVELPVKKDVLNMLQGSREIAMKRFLALERKFAKNPEFRNEYVKFMQDYLSLGHMRRVSEQNKDKTRVFLPHHAVIKESSATTKTRVVFDASSQYAKDIAKMYRQILVHESQTSLQSIIWRENPEAEIEEFELLTVTYGTKPASFLATRCLQQLAEVERTSYPKATEVVGREFYIDDLLTGANTEHEVITLKEELTELLAKGGFELHKWSSNLVTLGEDTDVKNEA
ncbi:PREDICTED: uncharacterized protein LOC105568535, partial [Vollenhovia emeryi]|uniref:uncharacterized protein LOC105568535 n=1 Tax=Vollenhovia emeryi TaxID=411798 RepID=UPI0005F4B57F